MTKGTPVYNDPNKIIEKETGDEISQYNTEFVKNVRENNRNM